MIGPKLDFLEACQIANYNLIEENKKLITGYKKIKSLWHNDYGHEKMAEALAQINLIVNEVLKNDQT